MLTHEGVGWCRVWYCMWTQEGVGWCGVWYCMWSLVLYVDTRGGGLLWNVNSPGTINRLAVIFLIIDLCIMLSINRILFACTSFRECFYLHFYDTYRLHAIFRNN